jgi:GT2 family glycosyltransferase
MHIRVVHGTHPVPSTIPATTIVVVTWNAMATLPACLEHLRRHTPTPHRLTIVDNASRDNTPAYLRTLQETQPHLRVIANKTNVGLPRAVRQAVAVLETEQVVLLAPDMLVTRDWLPRLTRHACVVAQVGAVGPLTNGAPGAQGLAHALDPAYWTGRAPDHIAAILHDRYTGETGITRYLSLSCLLIPRATLDTVGAPDPDFFLAGADLEYSLRCTRHGLRLALARDVYVHHLPAPGPPPLSPQGAADIALLCQKLAATWAPHPVPPCRDMWADITLADFDPACPRNEHHLACRRGEAGPKKVLATLAP